MTVPSEPLICKENNTGKTDRKNLIRIRHYASVQRALPSHQGQQDKDVVEPEPSFDHQPRI